MKNMDEWFKQFVIRLAHRLDPTCPLEVLERVFEGEVKDRRCLFVLRDAMLAAEAGLAWYPLPRLDDNIEAVLAWSARGLYIATIAEYFGSRRFKAYIASRGFWARRIIERFLHDYWLVSGVRILVTDFRAHIGWVSRPSLEACPVCGSGLVRERLEIHENYRGVYTALCGKCNWGVVVEISPPRALGM